MARSILDERLSVSERVARRTFEDETLLLNPDTGQYHALNETGARVLELLEGSDGTAREAVSALAAEFEVAADEIEGEMEKFFEALVERGLVEHPEEDDSA